MVVALGLKDVLSIDFEQDVVKAMSEKQEDATKEFLKYEKADMTDMKSIPDNSISVVVDKGSFDALCSDDSAETKAKCQKYLNEVFRVLSDKGGAFVCVSLLQDFVFKALTDFTNAGEDNNHAEKNLFDFRIQRIEKPIRKDPHAKEFVPYFCTVKKSIVDIAVPQMVELKKKISEVITFIEHRQIPPMVVPFAEIHNKIKNEQIGLMFAPQMKNLSKAQRFEIQAFDYKVSRVIPRYSLYIVDSDDDKILEKNTCACFITPQGRERDQMFCTSVGNFVLSKQAGFSRLIIAHLNHGHMFGDLEAVKNQLSPKVLELAPENCSNKKELPFLSIGSDIGKRIGVYRENGIIVEDYKVDTNEVYRQVVFYTKLEMVQSEAMLVYKNVKNQEEHFVTNSRLYPKKKQRVIIVNHDFLCSEYQRAKMMSIGLNPHAFKEALNFLVLGTGAGLLSMFIQNQFKDHINKLDTIDNNPTMLKIAEQQFGFHPAKFTKSHVGDALTYVNGLQKNFYNMICMDINYEEADNSISPPFKFMAPEYIARLIGLLKEEGLLTFNIICYDKKLLEQAVETLRAQESETVKLYFIHCESEMNYEIFFVKGQADFENREANLNAIIKERGINKGIWLNEMEMAEMVTKIKPIADLTGDEIKD
jgi:ubiquinone/menaquinone biosynthesis C-methylase UbiE